MRRNGTVDALRILAALGVVCFHARSDLTNFREVCYAGLVCFIVISTVFTLLTSPPQGAPTQSSLRRVLIPWAAWSLLFFGVSVYRGDLPDTNEEWLLLPLAGTSIHLWYLPFIAVVSIGLAFARRTMSTRALLMGGWVGLAAVTITAQFWRPWSFDQPVPLPQYMHALFPVFAGVLIFHDLERKSVLGTTFAIVCALALEPYHGLSIPYGVGILLCGAAFRYPRLVSTSNVTRLRYVSDCMFGVYLIHPLFFFVIRGVLGGDRVLFPIVTFLLATSVVLMIRVWNVRSVLLVFGIPLRSAPRLSFESAT